MKQVIAELNAGNVEDLKVQAQLDISTLNPFCKAVQGNKSVKRLDLSFVSLAGQFVNIFVRSGLNGNCVLQELDLKGCGLGPTGFREVITGICTRSAVVPALRTLLLEANDLDETIAADLELLGEEGHQLRRISLRDNQLGDRAARALAAALGRNRSIEMIDIGRNEVSHSGADSLLTVLKHNRTVQFLALDGNSHISQAQLMSIERALFSNRTSDHHQQPLSPRGHLAADAQVPRGHV